MFTFFERSNPMNQYKKHIFTAIALLLLLFGCMQTNLTQDNHLVEGTWVVLNEDTSINKQITFTETDFTDENNQVFPFRVDDETKTVFIMQDNKEEKEIPFQLEGDTLTFDGTQFIKYNSPTYTQILKDYQDYLLLQKQKAEWAEKVAPLRNDLLQAYQQANERINNGLRDFLVDPSIDIGWDNAQWNGTYNNDCYIISLGQNGNLSFHWFEASRHPQYEACTRYNESMYNANFIIPQETYKLSDYITHGEINEKFNIPLNDNVAITNVESEINRLYQLGFDSFIKNSTLLLTPNWKNEPVSDVTTLSIMPASYQNAEAGFNLTFFQINNINPDLNQMLITVNHGKGNRSFIVSKSN